MESPISILKQFVFPALRRIAPEKGDNLISAIEQKGITFRFIQNEDRILFTSNSINNIISVGEKCLERLWAMSYAYSLFYETMSKAKHRDLSVESIDIKSDPELEKAGELLGWATSVDWQIKAEGKVRQTPLPEWPESLPRPIVNPPKCSNEDVADNLFLCATGFVLHHELAHIQFGHTRAKGVESILNEKDADRAAAKWLLDGLQPSNNEFVQRTFGIAVALLWMATLEAYVPASSETHPPGYDRLYQTLSHFVVDDWHPVWSFVSIALTMHLDASGTPFDREMQHKTPRDAVNYSCDVLSKKFREIGF